MSKGLSASHVRAQASRRKQIRTDAKSCFDEKKPRCTTNKSLAPCAYTCTSHSHRHRPFPHSRTELITSTTSMTRDTLTIEPCMPGRRPLRSVQKALRIKLHSDDPPVPVPPSSLHPRDRTPGRPARRGSDVYFVRATVNIICPIGFSLAFQTKRRVGWLQWHVLKPLPCL